MFGLAFHSLLHTLRWQDVVDILLLTLIVSVAYRLIRRTVAVQVVLALIILLAGSWIANELGLILTSYLLSAVSAVATIAIVVLFQTEIRRTLARLNPSRWLRHSPAKGNRLDEAAIVAEAAFSLAARKKGALVVIPRSDPLADYVTAGTIIEARVSVALIETIFTSSSPLHDGAVVVREGRILRAGVVLPLATERADLSHGTRHRAALGLARATDALVVCVSEECGTVSLAHDEVLEAMADHVQLRRTLQVLGTSGAPRSESAPARLATSLGTFLPHFAIFIGVVGAWAALALDRSHAVTRIVPLEIRGIGEEMVVDPPRQNSVAVGLRSSRRELDRLPPGAVEAYVELSNTSLGSRNYRVLTRAPAGIEITSFVPEIVQVSAHQRPAQSEPNLHGESVAGKRLPTGTTGSAPEARKP
jgi:diadenylate cyclase